MTETKHHRRAYEAIDRVARPSDVVLFALKQFDHQCAEGADALNETIDMLSTVLVHGRKMMAENETITFQAAVSSLACIRMMRRNLA